MDIKEKKLRLMLMGIKPEEKRVELRLNGEEVFFYWMSFESIRTWFHKGNPHRKELVASWGDENELWNEVWKAFEWENGHGHKREET